MSSRIVNINMFTRRLLWNAFISVFPKYHITNHNSLSVFIKCFYFNLVLTQCIHHSHSLGRSYHLLKCRKCLQPIEAFVYHSSLQDHCSGAPLLQTLLPFGSVLPALTCEFSTHLSACVCYSLALELWCLQSLLMSSRKRTMNKLTKCSLHLQYPLPPAQCRKLKFKMNFSCSPSISLSCCSLRTPSPHGIRTCHQATTTTAQLQLKIYACEERAVSLGTLYTKRLCYLIIIQSL